MISPNGAMPPQSDSWWIDSWKSQIATGLALMQALCGIIVSISFTPTCVLAGVLQILAAIVVLAIEAPVFVSAIRFAQPISTFFDGKPVWVKCATYVSLTIIPCLLKCLGVFFILGFLCSLSIAALYGVLILGKKASRDDMRFQAASGMPGSPYSPTSP